MPKDPGSVLEGPDLVCSRTQSLSARAPLRIIYDFIQIYSEGKRAHEPTESSRALLPADIRNPRGQLERCDWPLCRRRLAGRQLYAFDCLSYSNNRVFGIGCPLSARSRLAGVWPDDIRASYVIRRRLHFEDYNTMSRFRTTTRDFDAEGNETLVRHHSPRCRAELGAAAGADARADAGSGANARTAADTGAGGALASDRTLAVERTLALRQTLARAPTQGRTDIVATAVERGQARMQVLAHEQALARERMLALQRMLTRERALASNRALAGADAGAAAGASPGEGAGAGVDARARVDTATGANADGGATSLPLQFKDTCIVSVVGHCIFSISLIRGHGSRRDEQKQTQHGRTVPFSKSLGALQTALRFCCVVDKVIRLTLL
ncbi:hypothetical protein EVAR_44636_1 [Eumeta japonica]|uniref:Uncharacterized protein n=1 Tax=Eumeta variegata TaxID=151549 RepID=A0A4C1ZS00_EUMVA|nr:hypothetical protein EVAR_44636_1 [Eumeta japonica]